MKSSLPHPKSFKYLTTASLSGSTRNNGPSSLPPSVLNFLSQLSFAKLISTTKIHSFLSSFLNSIKESSSKSIISEVTIPSKPSHCLLKSSHIKTSTKSVHKSFDPSSTSSSSNQSTKKPSSKIRPSKPFPKSMQFQIVM